jgi:hypothetical protein
VFPDLLSKHFCAQIGVVLTDGDTNEYEMIDHCLKELFVNATRIRCGWHIIDRGWSQHLDNIISVQNQTYKDQLGSLKHTIQFWMYSWMKRNCLFLDEYKASVALLFVYLKSSAVTQVIGTKNASQIMNFIRKFVLPPEMKYALYLRKNIFQLETYSNTPQEGMFNGMKYASSPVLPCHSLVESHEVQVYQDNKKTMNIEKEGEDELYKQ